MSFRVVRPDELEWITRPQAPGEPARHVAELSERLGFAHTRANIWRYEPGAAGRRHRHEKQEETFVVLSGTLSMYVGEPPERASTFRPAAPSTSRAACRCSPRTTATRTWSSTCTVHRRTRVRKSWTRRSSIDP